MAIWLAAGPQGQGLLPGGGRLQHRLARGVEHGLAVGADLGLFIVHRLGQGHAGVGRHALHHALPHQREGQDQGQGQQHVKDGAHQVDPEIADTAGLLALEAPHQGHHHGHAGGGGKEVLHRQAVHLGQVAHGGLAAVGLPVGVGDEADSGVESQVRRGVGHGLGIEGQPQLQALQGVDGEHAEQAEGQHGAGIAAPAHVVAVAHTGQAVAEVLQRPQPGHEGRQVTPVDAGHVQPQGPGQEEEDGEEEAVLQEEVGVHEKSSG
jgi:hypothetical protein